MSPVDEVIKDNTKTKRSKTNVKEKRVEVKWRHTSAWPAGASLAPKTERGRKILIPGESKGT